MGYKSSKYRSVAPLGPSCRKKSYQTKEEAEDMIRYIEETRMTRRLSTYRCEICGLWHLTSRSD
ncbi:MAG: hypothetical protein R2751_10300 [Bacteroidales bacterium]